MFTKAPIRLTLNEIQNNNSIQFNSCILTCLVKGQMVNYRNGTAYKGKP